MALNSAFQAISHGYLLVFVTNDEIMAKNEMSKQPWNWKYQSPTGIQNDAILNPQSLNYTP
jgi:hypothetical protein